MSAELVGILGIGAALFVGLGGLIFTAASGINRRIDAVDRRIESVDRRIDDLRNEVRGEIADLRAEVQGLDRRLSRIEGIIEGVLLRGGAPADGGEVPV